MFRTLESVHWLIYAFCDSVPRSVVRWGSSSCHTSRKRAVSTPWPRWPRWKEQEALLHYIVSSVAAKYQFRHRFYFG